MDLYDPKEFANLVPKLPLDVLCATEFLVQNGSQNV